MSLVPIDSRRLREQATRECRTVFSILDANRGQLLAFHREDLPAFRKWFYAKFGGAASRLRDLRQEILFQRSILAEVGDEVLFHSVTFEEALQRVQARRAGESAPPPPSDRASDPELHKLVGEILGGVGDELADAESGLLGVGPVRPGEPPPPCDEGRLRSLYRSLVRELHPDLHPDSSDERRELWHEVQSAYGRKDGERLELLAALLQVCQDKFDDGTPVSQIRALSKQLTIRIQALGREVARLSTLPAWNFGERESTRDLRREMSVKLREEIAQSRKKLLNLKKQFKRLSSYQPPRRATRGRADSAQLSFDF